MNLVSNQNLEALTGKDNANAPHCCDQTVPQPVFASVVIALVVIGLFGNTLVFFTIMVLREYKKSVTNWYILQLTLADTLFLLMLPFTAHSEITGTWDFSLSLCKLKEAVLFINYYASIYFLVIMSFDRYLAVTKALGPNTWVSSLRSPTASYIISVIGWVVSVLLCIQLFQYSKLNDCGLCNYEFRADSAGVYEIPDCIKANGTDCETEFEEYDGYEDLDYNGLTDNQLLELYNRYLSGRKNGDFFAQESSGDNSNQTTDGTIFPPSFMPKEELCQCRGPDSKVYRTWLYGNFFGAFVLPFLIICFFYGKIVRAIMQASSLGNNPRQRSYRRRVTMIVVALVTLFVISWLPWFVEKLVKINGISLSPTSCIKLTNAVRGFAYLNSAFNPYFYSFLGFHFCDRLKRAKSRMRIPSSIRWRATLVFSLRRRRYTTSNSVVSNQPNVNVLNFHIEKRKQDNERYEARFSTTDRKTEKTLI